MLLFALFATKLSSIEPVVTSLMTTIYVYASSAYIGGNDVRHLLWF